MAWLGLITWVTICGCVFTTAVTGRFSWILLCIWCIPVMGMSLFYEPGRNVNGLMVLLCVVMFLTSRKSLTDVRMWNLKLRKQHSFLFRFIYVFCFLVFYYCFWQAQKEGYIWDFQGVSSKEQNLLRLILTSLPIIALVKPLTDMIYNSLDRIWCKKNELVLLSCKFFLANSSGGEKGFWKGYYLDAIHNGVNYHFKMTKRTYAMLKMEKNLRLQVRVGILGGLYVLENPCPENVRKVRKKDRQILKIGVLLFLVTIIVGIWYFWF